MHDLLLIWGAGGHGKVVLDVAQATGQFRRIAFVDDNPGRIGSAFCDCEVIGGPDKFSAFPGSAFVIAVGDNHLRAQCFERSINSGLFPALLVHPSAVISPSASIGGGTVVMPAAVVNAGAVIGENCIVNTGAIVEHDCRVGDGVHLSPRSVLGGAVTVGRLAQVGIGAVVLPCASVGEQSVVGGGAVVLKETPRGSTVVGVPARVLSLTSSEL